MLRPYGLLQAEVQAYALGGGAMVCYMPKSGFADDGFSRSMKSIVELKESDFWGECLK